MFGVGDVYSWPATIGAQPAPQTIDELVDMVKDGRGVESALRAAKGLAGQACKQNDVKRLLTELIKQGQGVQDAINIVTQDFCSDFEKAQLAYVIFVVLVERQMGVQEAIDAAKRLIEMQTPDVSFRQLGVNLLSCAIKQCGQGIGLACDYIAAWNSRADDSHALIFTSTLWDAIMKTQAGQAHAAAFYINCGDAIDKLCLLRLLNAVKSCGDTSLLREVAQKALHSADEEIRKKGEEILAQTPPYAKSAIRV